MNIGARVKLIRKSRDLTQTDFATKMGLTLRGIQNWEAGDGADNIRESSLILICKTFDVNKEWLLTGNGDMFIAKDKKLTTASSEFIDGAVSVKYFTDVVASAGHGAINECEEFVNYYINNNIDVDTKYDVIINIVGNSMAPTLIDKDMVLVSTNIVNDLAIDNIYVLITHGALLAKRFSGMLNNAYVFSSDNSIYHPVYLDKDDDANKIVGVVKGLLYRKIRAQSK